MVERFTDLLTSDTYNTSRRSNGSVMQMGWVNLSQAGSTPPSVVQKRVIDARATDGHIRWKLKWLRLFGEEAFWCLGALSPVPRSDFRTSSPCGFSSLVDA